MTPEEKIDFCLQQLLAQTQALKNIGAYVDIAINDLNTRLKVLEKSAPPKSSIIVPGRQN